MCMYMSEFANMCTCLSMCLCVIWHFMYTCVCFSAYASMCVCVCVNIPSNKFDHPNSGLYILIYNTLTMDSSHCLISYHRSLLLYRV